MQESVSSMESFGALKQRYKNASHSGMNERYWNPLLTAQHLQNNHSMLPATNDRLRTVNGVQERDLTLFDKFTKGPHYVFMYSTSFGNTMCLSCIAQPLTTLLLALQTHVDCCLRNHCKEAPGVLSKKLWNQQQSVQRYRMLLNRNMVPAIIHNRLQEALQKAYAKSVQHILFCKICIADF